MFILHTNLKFNMLYTIYLKIYLLYILNCFINLKCVSYIYIKLIYYSYLNFICYIYKVALQLMKRVLSISFSFEIILSNNSNIQCIVHLQDTMSIFNIEGSIGLETTFINDGTFSNHISLINNSYSVTSCEMDVDSGNYSSSCLLFCRLTSSLNKHSYFDLSPKLVNQLPATASILIFCLIAPSPPPMLISASK